MSKNHSFKEISVTPIKDWNGRLHFYRHENGAELAWFERDCDNKTFAVGFQTLPEDDTGVFHILEHSVLCGSAKYPVKEPFVELLKGSLNTFLNAMTFPDKTIYPVSSRNDADFQNLMHVYLDAVFNPEIYRNPNIFRQEGWHYEIGEDGIPKIVGVVHGEMTGAYSSVDTIIYTSAATMLFPDTYYRFSSGGDPKKIPELTYEQFINNHKRFYHPSHAKFFLDGKLDIEAIMADIDSGYLKGAEHREPNFAVTYQGTLPECEKTVKYEIAPDDTAEGKSYFTMSKIIGRWDNAERLLAAMVLEDYLAGSNSAPVTRAVLEQGLGQDFSIDIDEHAAQNYYVLQVKNCADDKLPGMKDKIRDIFRSVLEKGLDREELTASLNRLEFKFKEPSEPQGVEFAITAYLAWNYGGDPSLYLNIAPVFEALREKLDTDYFEKLLSELFIESEGAAILTAVPSNTLGAENAAAERARLEEIAAAWTAEERAKIEAETAALKQWQQAPDSEEQLSKLPHLDVKDIPTEPVFTECDEECRGNVRILRPRLTSGPVYINMYFALPAMSLEKLSALSLMTELMAQLPTKSSSREALTRKIKTYLGSVSFTVVPVGKPTEPDVAVCFLRASCSVLEENIPHAISILREILTETEFDNEAMIKEIVSQSFIGAEQSIIVNGHSYAFHHALSGFTAEGAVSEATEYFGYYQFLKAQNTALDMPSLLDTFGSVMGRLSDLPLTVAITGNMPDSAADELTAGFGGKGAPEILKTDGFKAVKQSAVIPAGVAYAIIAGNLCRLGYDYNGSYALASQILSYSYLWNEVRVQGGAYGTGLRVRTNGDLFYYSYRDPNPSRSMGIYRRSAEYLRDFCKNHEDFSQMLIGSVSASEPLFSASVESQLAAENVLRGITIEDKRRNRRELLSTDYADILRFADMLDRLSEDEAVCIVGSEALLDSCGEDGKNRL